VVAAIEPIKPKPAAADDADPTPPNLWNVTVIRGGVSEVCQFARPPAELGPRATGP